MTEGFHRCAIVVPMDGEVTEVTPDDVERLISGQRPGALVPSTALFTLYVRLMESDRRPVATRNALGRALSQAGCKRQRIKRRGVEIHAWRMPGPPLSSMEEEEKDRVRAVHRELGEGIHPNTLVNDTYQRLARKHVWHSTLSESQLASLLTKMGYVRMTEKGAPSRYFSTNPR